VFFNNQTITAYKKMKKIAALILSLIAGICSYGQGQVFKTYEEYLNKTGEAYDEGSISTAESDIGYGNMKIIVKNANGSTVRYRPADIWGFTFKGHLFRTTERQFAMLKDTGKVCFYINGIGAIEALQREDGKGTYLLSESNCFLSVGGINTKLYGLPADNKFKKDLTALKKEHPELQSIIDCAKGEPAGRVRGCVQAYNQSH
jgi:hypothetical protein